MSVIARRGFGATELKVAVAGVFLVGAVSVAAYRLAGNRRPPVAGAREIGPGQAINNEGETLETNYEKVRSKDDVRTVMARFDEGVSRAAHALDLTGAGGADRVAASARDAIEPILLDDYDAFVASVQRLGGTIDPDSEEKSRLYEMLTNWFAMGDPDLDRMVIKPYEGMGQPGGPASEQPRRVSRTMDEDMGEGQGPGVAERRMGLRAASLYPDVDVEDSSAVQPIEVTVPIRPTRGPHKGGEVTLGIVLAWNPEANAWQPGMYSMTTYSMADGEEGP